MTSDTEYYRIRALEQREAARESGQSYIAEIHIELAKAYDILAEKADQRSARRLVTEG